MLDALKQAEPRILQVSVVQTEELGLEVLVLQQVQKGVLGQAQGLVLSVLR